MKVSPGQNQGTPVEPPSTPATQVKNERAPTPAPSISTPEKATATASAAAVPPLERPTDVTLRRDTNGRVYYVVSDASSGQEILEVPPKAIRDVGQGIEDYLKQAESKASTHIKVKA
jgi:hypothetical protein